MSSTAVAPPEPRVRRKTFTCTTGVEWSGRRSGALSTKDKPLLPVGPDLGAWSPEDLFVASVNACTMMGFMTLAEKQHIEVESYSSEAVGTMEYVDDGYRFTEVVVRPRVVVVDASDVRVVAEALAEAHKSCLIGNSIRGVVVLEPGITFSGED